MTPSQDDHCGLQHSHYPLYHYNYCPPLPRTYLIPLAVLHWLLLVEDICLRSLIFSQCPSVERLSYDWACVSEAGPGPGPGLQTVAVVAVVTESGGAAAANIITTLNLSSRLLLDTEHL